MDRPVTLEMLPSSTILCVVVCRFDADRKSETVISVQQCYYRSRFRQRLAI
jgi:hypothetical protein